MITPPPLADADPHTASPAEAPREITRKPWSKPTISTMNGPVEIGSGSQPQLAENANYRPS